MGLSMIVLIIVGIGGCALVAAALIGVIWALVGERQSRRGP